NVGGVCARIGGELPVLQLRQIELLPDAAFTELYISFRYNFHGATGEADEVDISTTEGSGAAHDNDMSPVVVNENCLVIRIRCKGVEGNRRGRCSSCFYFKYVNVKLS